MLKKSVHPAKAARYQKVDDKNSMLAMKWTAEGKKWVTEAGKRVKKIEKNAAEMEKN